MGTRVTVLAGGYGGAKLSHGFALASAAREASGAPPLDLAVVVNTGDDLEVHGLYVSPDLDTVMYTLAGLANDATGWGVRDETWSSAEMLERLGAPTWFRIGDRDITVNLLRTERLRAGQRLTEVTAGLAEALGVRARLLPVTDDPVRTQLLTASGWLEFQEYFVHRHHADRVTDPPCGRGRGEPDRGDARGHRRRGPRRVRALEPVPLHRHHPRRPRVAEAIAGTPAPVVGVSPIVGGVALRGPADDCSGPSAASRQRSVSRRTTSASIRGRSTRWSSIRWTRTSERWSARPAWNRWSPTP